jgi:sodium transport system permease protein
MNRLSRISTIARKELVETLRDRRTLIAMVLVPMVLYPALMLGMIQGVEVQVGFLVQEEYDVGVASNEVRDWLQRLIDEDSARRAVERVSSRPGTPAPRHHTQGDGAISRAREEPPRYSIMIVSDVQAAVNARRVHVGLVVEGPPPRSGSQTSTPVALVYDESEIRGGIAASGLESILERFSEHLTRERLRQRGLPPDFIQPLALVRQNIATSDKMARSALGQVVPLILIIMTITGAIYPAIDLTAGERERGTLETLMVAPVPTLDLIVGKFCVVTMVGLMSAVLNLASIGGTVYLGGFGELLAQGSEFVVPLSSLPWILLLLIPLAVMFSAMLLAVCSFARSFKEAQNYVVPVMIAAMIPGIVGVLPGTRLEGPIVVMPVANVVVLTRELLLGRFDPAAVALVALSTSLYAAAAIAVAARLFGQEAVLFSDAGSIRTLFQRRFFKPALAPTPAASLLVLAIVYSLNFYLQQSIALAGFSDLDLLAAVCLTLVVLLGLGPLVAARYTRVNVVSAFRLRLPTAGGWAAALCFGLSTWILAQGLIWAQRFWLPIDPSLEAAMKEQLAFLPSVNPWAVVFLLAVVPALAEEWFFRGYVLSGVRAGLGRWGALLIVSAAFGLYHFSAHRLVMTTLLGVMLGLLVLRFNSLLPAILAHALHNAFIVLSDRADGLRPLLERVGYFQRPDGLPGLPWLIGAGLLTGCGVVLCLLRGRSEPRLAVRHGGWPATTHARAAESASCRPARGARQSHGGAP